jgi:hypothetical protein
MAKKRAVKNRAELAQKAFGSVLEWKLRDLLRRENIEKCCTEIGGGKINGCGRADVRCRMIIGHGRVSTDGQTLDAQQAVLKGAGAEKVYAEKISGTPRHSNCFPCAWRYPRIYRLDRLGLKASRYCHALGSRGLHLKRLPTLMTPAYALFCASCRRGRPISSPFANGRKR